MADRRIKDLSYGRLGKPIYDTQLGWTFSQAASLEQSIQRVLPLEEQLQPSIQATPENNQKGLQPPFKTLVEKNLDLHPAEAIATTLSRATDNALGWQNEGTLLSVGKGLDRKHLSTRDSTFPIIAMPYGDAGHILRIVRPRVEKRSWVKNSSVSLPFLHAQLADEGFYKIGSSGTIAQIAFSEEEDGPGTWLAVRQSTTTTVLQITYSEEEDQSSVLGGVSAIKYTNLMPSSVVTFPLAQNSRRKHSDVAFNPLYNRQIAIVDQSGRWSIWDNEPRHSKKTLPKLVVGKSGSILDDYNPDPQLRIPVHSLPDGWHRIFWVCNLSTILVCSRTHLAIFDISSKISRLDSTDFLVAKGIEIILDVKRNATNLKHVYVLTTFRIYWLEVLPAGEKIDGTEVPGGVKMLLSYRHFRSESDDTMRLITPQDDVLSVLIYSSVNHLVNFYSFSVDKEEVESHQPQSSQGSFCFTGKEDTTTVETSWNKSAKTILIVPSTLEHSGKSDGPGGLGLRYLEEGIRFLQPLILTLDLGLSSTLCAVGTGKQMLSRVNSPLAIVKLSRSAARRLGKRRVIGGFIVNDEEDDLDEETPLILDRRPKERPGAFLMSWRHIFESVFLDVSDDDGETAKSDILLQNVLSSIQTGLEEDDLTMKTLLESTSFSKLSENLEDVRTALNEFFDLLPQDSESLSQLVISNTTVCPGVELPLDEDLKSADMMKIYQDLVDKWIASLPLQASNAVRGSKFRAIRQITAELFLSSITISLRSKSSMVPTVVLEKDDEVLVEHDAGMSTRESSPATFFSAQRSLGTQNNAESTLRTPSQTQSTYSRLTSASGHEEDSAISRLRQYAVSIKSRSDVGKSKILSEWPTVPGVDPASYVYKPKATSDDEDSAPESSKNKRNAARRKKRTEKLLQKNGESSGGVGTPSGSQPVRAQPSEFTSQQMEAMAMTQPETGHFGTRDIMSRKYKKLLPKRTAGF